MLCSCVYIFDSILISWYSILHPFSCILTMFCVAVVMKTSREQLNQIHFS